ncbi:MAG: glycogen synthase [Candidatus Krumholzibacteriia bacterium]
MPIKRNVLMVTAELAPWAKVGGLGDVAQALSAALAGRGHDVRVVLPLYGHLDRARLGIRPLKKLPPLSLRVGQKVHDVRFHVQGPAAGRLKIYLVECEDLFAGRGIYTGPDGKGFADSLERASLHAQAALLLPRLLGWPVAVVHAHDAEAAPALLFRDHWYAGRDLPGPAATVLTIHNLAHQEIHLPDRVLALGLPRSLAVYPGILEFHGRLNLLKAGIASADRVNTVSPTYARETVADPAYGCGLEGVLGARGAGYSGILNGADYEVWDPLRDPHLPENYGPDRLRGKKACREALADELGLAVPGNPGRPDKPLCGFVGRLVQQKGVDLLIPLLERLAGDGFTFAVLGTGDRDLEDALAAVAVRMPDAVSFTRVFDEALAHRIYAGCDLFLMPSLFEPCGLSQMYALKYGSPPVVRRTGGLADTVTDAEDPAGTGFVFDQARPEVLLACLRRAEALWDDPDRWAALQARGMDCEFGWSRAAASYEDVYLQALEARTIRA